MSLHPGITVERWTTLSVAVAIGTAVLLAVLFLCPLLLPPNVVDRATTLFIST